MGRIIIPGETPKEEENPLGTHVYGWAAKELWRQINATDVFAQMLKISELRKSCGVEEGEGGETLTWKVPDGY